MKKIRRDEKKNRCFFCVENRGFYKIFLISNIPFILCTRITLNNKVIGSIGIFRCDNIHFRTAEIGYFIGEQYWGNGFMTSAIIQACDYIFENTEAELVQLMVFPENARAKRCYEKAGFVERSLTENAFSYKDEFWGRCNMILKRGD